MNIKQDCKEANSKAGQPIVLGRDLSMVNIQVQGGKFS
jgi:hypothetical protein